MPPRRTGRTRHGEETVQNNMYVGAAMFRHLTTQQLQELCRRNGLSALGRRTALEKRLKDAGTAVAAQTDDSQPQNHPNQPPNPLNEQRANPAAFTDEQISQISRLVQDSVASAAREIAREAARAATEASQTMNRSNPGISTTSGSQEQQQAGQSLQVNDGLLSTLPCQHAAPFEEIPASYVKDIQSGEFFDLSKLLPKNLSLHDENDNLTLSLDNSVIKVSKKSGASTSITDIEQWTTAFTTYLSVFSDKFPLRSQELLQYLSLIRYAARVHKGLGWVIYDYKFRQKASKNKSLVWSTIDSQLWLTLFTVPPAVLREEYPLFSKGPSSSSANSRGSYTGICFVYNRAGSCTRHRCRYRHICNRCDGAHPGCECPSFPRQQQRDDGRDKHRDYGNAKSSSSRKHK